MLNRPENDEILEDFEEFVKKCEEKGVSRADVMTKMHQHYPQVRNHTITCTVERYYYYYALHIDDKKNIQGKSTTV